MTQRQEQARRIRREQVERYLATGMTVKEWCSINGVSASTMYYWMARLRKEEPGLFGDPTCGEWMELSRGSIAARTALAVRPAGALVVRIGVADVVVPEGASEAHLSMVLREVASI